METTVSGLFATAAAAQKARLDLQSAGFPLEHTVVITNETEHRHELIGEETSDAVRGSRLGAIVGAVGMGIGGAAIGALFQVDVLYAALGGALLGALGGGLIGFLVGSATGHQVQEEYEHGIERGGVVVAVNTDRSHAHKAHDVMTRAGGHSMSTSVHSKHHAVQQQSA